MLDLYVERAGISDDGQEVLDLGCGWGSVALYLAARFPSCRVTALSNSATQKEFVDSTARERHLTNLVVYTGDVAVFNSDEFMGKFDIVISIEMFEHMKNYRLLLEKVASWLKKPGSSCREGEVLTTEQQTTHYILNLYGKEK